ncbi:MAG: DEAD/DEAH box helicase, partial [Candidatus Thermoplasmatota archaeon]|nr:DEAD/DEAH box helicase [Candidatus Thermoplasmatota archaeon]
GLTEPQAYAIPVIHNRENVLVCSPTGSGKTLTAFLAIINELYQKQLRDELEDRIYCLYISPLKALANDIRRNLTTPLEELKALAKETSRPVPKIRTGVRSGDTSASERSKMARKPPHIFITTPESMALILSTPKFSENLAGLEYLIVDEIHEMCNNKRGTMLSLSMERLQERAGNFTRVGLSATQAPIETIAEFLAGRENGKTRPMGIVEVESKKKLDIEVLCPVEDMTALPFEVVNDRMYDLVGELVKKHTTTIVFTNTRAGTESVSYRLQEKGIERLAAHHGSLSKETRLDVEEELKQGKLRGVVSSTSLELGIDIGSIDLVCQIGSPKSIAKGLQRIGRAGHSVGAVPTGRFIVFESDDLVECAVLARHA